MNPPVIETQRPRTWRDLPQPITPRAMSQEGRRRRALAMVRTAMAVILVLGAGWAGAQAFSSWRKNPGALVAPASSSPMRSLVVRSDGVLGEQWVRETMALPPKVSLMALNLETLRSKLLASGQVREAELVRQFPDRLNVTLRERVPVVRVLGQGADAGLLTPYLVAKEGTVFSGANISAEQTARLPMLEGVSLIRSGPGFAPIEGMSAVADLLAAARTGAPTLGKGFKSVSLARLANDGAIVVRSDEVGEIVFAAREPFARQLSRLEIAVTEARNRIPAEHLRVDLAIGSGQVLVTKAVVAATSSQTDRRLTLPAARPTNTAPTTGPSVFLRLPPSSSAPHAL